MPEFPDIPSGNAIQSGDFIIGYRGATDYRFPFDNFFDNVDTDDIAEGVSALYYTDERVDDRVGNSLIQNGTGITWSYNDGAGTLTPTVSLSAFTTANLNAGSSGVNQYFQQVSVDLTDASIKTLNGTPVDFLGGGLGSADPNTGYLIVGCTAKPEISSTGYTVSSTIDIIDSSTGNVLFSFAGTLLSGVSTTDIYHALPVTAAGPIITAGGTVAVKAASANPSGGDVSNTCKVVLSVATVNFASF